jgi:hypothetical protein
MTLPRILADPIARLGIDPAADPAALREALRAAVLARGGDGVLWPWPTGGWNLDLDAPQPAKVGGCTPTWTLARALLHLAGEEPDSARIAAGEAVDRLLAAVPAVRERLEREDPQRLWFYDPNDRTPMSYIVCEELVRPHLEALLDVPAAPDRDAALRRIGGFLEELDRDGEHEAQNLVHIALFEALSAEHLVALARFAGPVVAEHAQGILALRRQYQAAEAAEGNDLSRVVVHVWRAAGRLSG